MEYKITTLAFGVANLASPKPPKGDDWEIVNFAVTPTNYHILWKREPAERDFDGNLV